MIFSMTGYGRGEAIDRGKRFVVEIKTVNHRYNDINLKLPRQVSFLETTARSLIKERIPRGKVDVVVTYDDLGEQSKTVMVDWSLVDNYIRVFRAVKDQYKLDGEVSLSLLAGFHELFRVEQPEDDEEAIAALFEKAAEQALVELMRMRASEGEKLKADIQEKLAAIASKLTDIESKAETVVVEYKDKLEKRIKELLEQQVIDENRLAAECAYFAERCCINEEIVRMKSHIRQMEEALSLAEPVGRKMDFIVQEMNREVNTIASKSSHIDIIKCVVDIKSFIDKIREQVQNIE